MRVFIGFAGSVEKNGRFLNSWSLLISSYTYLRVEGRLRMAGHFSGSEKIELNCFTSSQST